MKLTLQQMRYVNKVAEAGSLTEAAKLLSVSQAALSTSISQLENELGVELFARKGRGFKPTEEGMRFLALSERVLDDVGEIERKFFSPQGFSDELNVSSMPLALAERPFINYLTNVHSDSASLSLERAKPPRIVKDVANGVKNLGIIYCAPGPSIRLEQILNENDVEFHELLSASPSVFVLADHPLAALSEVTQEDLKPYREFPLEPYLFVRLFETEESCGPAVEWRDGSLVSQSFSPIDDLLLKAAEIEGYTTWARVGIKACTGDVRAIPLQSEETYVFGYIKKKGEGLNELEKDFLEYYKAWMME